MKRFGGLVVALGALAIAGCGSNSSSESSTAASTTTEAVRDSADQTAAPKGKRVKTVSSQYGKVVADAKGEALYLFTKEKGTKSKCYGDCAAAWPPMLTKGDPRAGNGVTESRLGTTERRDGRTQVTYDGHPLYYYREDSPGHILCQDVAEFGGSWYVVKPSGAPVT